LFSWVYFYIYLTIGPVVVKVLEDDGELYDIPQAVV
jgi:hypothetical protein